MGSSYCVGSDLSLSRAALPPEGTTVRRATVKGGSGGGDGDGGGGMGGGEEGASMQYPHSEQSSLAPSAAQCAALGPVSASYMVHGP